MARTYLMSVRWSLSHILAFLVSLGGPPADASTNEIADDPVLSRGLEHTTEGRLLLEAAVASTNLMTDGRRGPVLATFWTRGRSDETVPVYLVKSGPGATSTPAVVPRGCSCIFVDLQVFEGWIRGHSTGPGRMSLEPKYLLTFMLLHEVGHLYKRSSGAEFANGNLSQLNVDPSLAKAREEEADDFSAGLIRERSRATPASTTSLEANWVAIELTKLSWNMQAYRTLDEFAAFATGKPSVYFDQNLTHPNLAWRVLRSNYLIQQSKETKELLDAFEEARQRGANPQPLYRKQGRAK